jgi:hypothetical protein
MTRSLRVALATYPGIDSEFSDDPLLLELLHDRDVQAEWWAWSDPTATWDETDLVVIRTTWDYARHHARFLGWLRDLPVPVENAPPLVRWNSDKHYLDDLAGAGIATVPTRFVAPDAPVPDLEAMCQAAPTGELVVKPTVSAGGRDTGRFSSTSLDEARELLRQIGASGRVAMVQPFYASVVDVGETAVVLIDGAVSHVLRKGSVLGPDEVAPLASDALGAAAVMYDPGLVVAGQAAGDELALAQQTLR